MQIVGIEGSSHGDGPSWGTAVLSDGTDLINATSGVRCSLTRGKELVAQGHLTLFSEPIPWEGGIVLRIPMEHMLPLYKGGETGRPWFEDGGCFYTTFLNLEYFKGWAWAKANMLCEEALLQDSPESAQILLMTALILDHDHEKANALYVLTAPTSWKRSVRERFAIATIKGSGQNALDTFEMYLQQIKLPAHW